MANAEYYQSLLEKVSKLQDMLVARATGGSIEWSEYEALREALAKSGSVRRALPQFVFTCRSEAQYWAFIKSKFATYAERRNFLWKEFAGLLETLEEKASSPIDRLVSETLTKLESRQVLELWDRALERRLSDPDGALTAARTLLESVCKGILDELAEPYSTTADLPLLYHLTAQKLNIAPSQHTEKVFKQILGGCQSVVEGLGSLRNKLGDAHGQGKRPIRPAPRHAALAVNLAGAMALFLAETFEYHLSQARA